MERRDPPNSRSGAIPCDAPRLGGLLALGLLGAALGSDPAAGVETRISADEGLVIEDPEREISLGVDGRFDLDWVQYDDRNVRDSGVRLDRALLGPWAHWRDVVKARVTFDLAGIDTRWGLWEAYASAQARRWVRLSVGLLPLPLGVEHSIREGARPLVGLPSFPAFLTGRTDWAVELDGELAEGVFSYDLAGAVGEGFDLVGQRRGDAQLSARVMTYPLRFVDWSVSLGPYEFPLVSGVFASFGYGWSPDDYSGHLTVDTPLRNTLFDTNRLDGRGADVWDLAFGIDFGPLRVFHETVRGSIDQVRLPSGMRADFDDQITAWHLVVSFRVTGEPYDTRSFRQRDMRRPSPPRHPLDGEGDARGFGALELAFRYANADIDRDFETLGLVGRNPDAPPPENFLSSQEFRTLSFGVNWDPTSYLRVSVEVVRVIADQYPAAFDSHGRDTSGMLRIQYAF